MYDKYTKERRTVVLVLQQNISPQSMYLDFSSGMHFMFDALDCSSNIECRKLKKISASETSQPLLPAHLSCSW